jgi:hypothetical protein
MGLKTNDLPVLPSPGKTDFFTTWLHVLNYSVGHYKQSLKRRPDPLSNRSVGIGQAALPMFHWTTAAIRQRLLDRIDTSKILQDIIGQYQLEMLHHSRLSTGDHQRYPALIWVMAIFDF